VLRPAGPALPVGPPDRAGDRDRGRGPDGDPGRDRRRHRQARQRPGQIHGHCRLRLRHGLVLFILPAGGAFRRGPHQ
nr:hypothetical protein [Tanacetum cinerariifolium]